MFGYIRPVRPDMLVGDDELYSAVYCGLCRYSGRHVTHASRFLLNYDFAFLAVLRASLTNEEIRTERVRCPYKFRKRSSAVCDGAFASVAGYFGILTYYKMLDDLNDERGWKKFGKKFLLPLASRMRKKARALGTDEKLVTKPLEDLAALEKEGKEHGDVSPDRAADCFARLTAGITSEGLTGTDADIARQCGYHIGRFVYLIDALDDLEEDAKSGNFNPFLLRYGSLSNAQSHADEIRTTLEDSMRVFSRTYALRCGPVLTPLDRIIFNIADLGGKAAVARVLSGRNNRKAKRNLK